MFTFYKVDVNEDGWVFSYLTDDKVTKIKNDKGALQRLLSNTSYLVGYDNYNLCDKLLASILKDIDPCETLQKITSNKRFTLSMQNPVTIDLKQELNAELQEVKYNLGFENNYCDLTLMKQIFGKREDYLSSKFEVVKEFKLRAESLKKTRVNLASDVLKGRKETDKERLNLIYDERLYKNELPKSLIRFYEDIQKRFKKGEDFGNLEKEKFTFKLAGLEHVFGFGGLHAANEKYVGEGHFMQIDVKSYYPSLIINNELLKGKALDYYKAIYKDRQKLQTFDDPKEKAYKLILNIVYGGLKSKWVNLYNPQASNNIVVNGQLIMTHLILLLENFCKLIQTNTDGIIIKYEPVMKESIYKIVKLFGERYALGFDIKEITKIAQRDVNNYVIKYDDGVIKGVGRFKNFEGGDFERNSLTIIDKALVDYFMNGVKVNTTIIAAWKRNELHWFQSIVKNGSYDGMAQETKHETLFEGTYDTSFKDIDKVNRVFATRDKSLGGIYRTKNDKETKYTKVSYTSENCLVWNGSLEKLNKRLIDLNWYIKECERWLF